MVIGGPTRAGQGHPGLARRTTATRRVGRGPTDGHARPLHWAEVHTGLRLFALCGVCRRSRSTGTPVPGAPSRRPWEIARCVTPTAASALVLRILSPHVGPTPPYAQTRIMPLTCTIRADDGIRTRDPHLGKVRRGADREPSLALTCPFRYDSAQFSTARYMSFFPVLPRAILVGPRLDASSTASKRGGKRYRARYQSGGSRVTAQVPFATKADANAWLASQQTDAGRGTWVDPSSGKELFGEYARKSLDSRADLAPDYPGQVPRTVAACTSCPPSAIAASPRSTPRRCATGTTP